MFFRVGPLPTQIEHEAGRGLMPAGGEIDILLDGENRNDAIAFAVLRAEDESGVDGGTRGRVLRNLPGNPDSAAGAIFRAVDEAKQFAAPRTNKTEHADNLTLRHLETDGRRHARTGHALDRESAGTVRTGGIIENIAQIASDHRTDDLVDGEPGHRVEGADMPAIAQNRDGIADREDLVHAVRHIKDHVAARLEIADDGKEPLDLAGGKTARRLIEGDDARAAREGLGNFHQLALRDGQMADLGVGIDFLADPCEVALGLGTQLAAIHDAALGRQVAEKQILRDTHFRHEKQFLVDHGDAGTQRGGGVGEHVAYPVDPERATRGRVGAAQDFQQRGLARAVFPHERMDPAALRRERNAIKRPDSGEFLGDGVEDETGRHVRDDPSANSLFFQYRSEVGPVYHHPDGVGFQGRFSALLDPQIKHLRSLVAVLTGGKERGSKEPGGLGLLEFSDAIRAVDPDADDCVRRKPPALGRPHRTEYGIVVHAANEPVLHLGMLREQDVGRIEGTGNIRGFLRCLVDSFSGEARRDQRVNRAVGAVLGGIELLKRHGTHGSIGSRKIPRGHLGVQRSADGFADFPGGNAEVMNVGHRFAIGTDKAVVDRNHLEGTEFGLGHDGRPEARIRRTDDKTLGSRGGEIVDGRQQLFPIRHTDLHDLEAKLPGGLIGKLPFELKPRHLGLLDKKSDLNGGWRGWSGARLIAGSRLAATGENQRSQREKKKREAGVHKIHGVAVETASRWFEAGRVVPTFRIIHSKTKLIDATSTQASGSG